MNIHELLLQLEDHEKIAKRYYNILSFKDRPTKKEAKDVRQLIAGYLEINQKIMERLKHELISKKDILESETVQKEPESEPDNIALINKSKREMIEERERYEKPYRIKLLQLQDKLNDLRIMFAKEKKILEQEKNEAILIFSEKTKGFPWLAEAWSDYLHLCDLKEADHLEEKKYPAKSAAQRIREIAQEKRTLGKQFRVTRNLIKYYEALFPWLPEFVGEDLDDLIMQITNKSKREDKEEDPVKFYLTEGEYENLSVTERNQRALDRYWLKKKSNWELGRDYERYIGYLYEAEGYKVYYQGIEEGLEDLGRDLIAEKDRETKVIQCKYWAKHKTIHEKHICQLFGTTLKYWIEHQHSLQEYEPDFFLSLIQGNVINGVFVTSTRLSDVAKEFATELGIEVKERYPLKQYPSIKCNVSRSTGEKIYHLPMDQQYDRTVIEEQMNECYVKTVSEAESLGFRRAYRWRGLHE